MPPIGLCCLQVRWRQTLHHQQRFHLRQKPTLQAAQASNRMLYIIMLYTYIRINNWCNIVYFYVIFCNHVQAQSIRLWTLEFRPPEGDLISPLLLCSKNVTMASQLFAGIKQRTWVSLTVGPTAAKIGTCILCLAKEPRSQGCVMQDCFHDLLSDSIFMRAEVVSK